MAIAAGITLLALLTKWAISDMNRTLRGWFAYFKHSTHIPRYIGILMVGFGYGFVVFGRRRGGRGVARSQSAIVGRTPSSPNMGSSVW